MGKSLYLISEAPNGKHKNPESNTRKTNK